MSIRVGDAKRDLEPSGRCSPLIRAITTLESTLGRDSYEVALACHELSLVLASEGKVEESIRYCELALGIYRNHGVVDIGGHEAEPAEERQAS